MTFLILLLFLLLLPAESKAQTPETSIIIAPTAEIPYNDVTFWWVGESNTDLQIIGYYYKLDSDNFTFTTNHSITLYNLPDGAHTFSVKAVDEKFFEDPSPATRSFSIKTSTQGETEPNDLIEQTNQISAGSPISALSWPKNDIDWFKLKIPDVKDVKQVSVCFERPQGVGSTKISLFRSSDAEDNKLGEVVANVVSQERVCFTTGIRGAGDYFIKITPAADEAVSLPSYAYSLTVVTGDLPAGISWDSEANNIAEFANELDSNFALTSIARAFGGTNKNSDQDWYRIHITSTAQKRMILNLTRPQASGSTKISIYSGLPISDLRKVSEGAADVTKAQKVLLAPTVSFGDYYISIDNSAENSSAAYLLSLKLENLPSGQLLEFEPNSASPTANPKGVNPLPIGKTLTGTSWGNNDDDWFKLEVSEAGIIGISFARTSGVGSTKIEFYNLNLLKLGEFVTSSSNSQKGSKSFSVSAGTYYIKVDPDSEDPLAEYQLAALFIKSASHNAKPPLGKGATLRVVLVGAIGWKVNFDLIGNFASPVVAKRFQAVEMSDDGGHTDGLANDGVYAATVKIEANNDVMDATASIHIKDQSGQASSEVNLELADKITIDTLAPLISSISAIGGRALSLGEKLTVTLKGDAGQVGSFEIRALVNEELQIVTERLFDDGLHSDGAANDGLYVGNYTVKAADNLPNAVILAKLSDTAGNTSALAAADAISLGEKIPSIVSTQHNATRVLKRGELLKVTLTGAKGGAASFNIGSFKTGIPMFDDGQHEDGAANDGIYVGSYLINLGDSTRESEITVQLLDSLSNSAQVMLIPKVTIDAIPPSPVTGVKASDRPNDEGGIVLISWQPSAASDFARYQIYFERNPIVTTSNLTPKKVDITDAKITQTEILLPNSRDLFYIAVTAVDTLGNESELLLQTNGSVSAPVQATDNLPPQAVETVSVFDTPDDKGGMITVVWSKPSAAADFSHYDIYLSETPIELGQTQGLGRTQGSPLQGQPIAVIKDRNALFADLPVKSNSTNYFVAVTAVDLSGNASPLSPHSIAGPVIASDNIGVLPDTDVQIVNGPSGLIRHNDVHFKWSRFGLRRTFIGYFYQIDNGEFQFTESDQVSFFDLPEGRHVFAVKSADGNDLPTSRAFTISTAFTSETEPNDAITSANLLPFNLTMLGKNQTNSDSDWFKFLASNLGFITLTVSRPNGIGETILKIYKSDVGAGLKPAPDSIVGTLKLNSFNKQQDAFSFAVDRGEYFIEVSTSSESLDSEYQLAINLTEMKSGENWELEPNNSAFTATLLPFSPQGVRLFASTWDGNSDQDWYRFDLKESATLVITFERASSSGSTKISLRDSASNEIKSATADISNRWQGVLNVALTPGVYLLQIEPKAELKGSSYKLEALNVIPPTPIKGVRAFDKPNDEGKTIIVSWISSTDSDFSNYRIYLDVSPIVSTTIGQTQRSAPTIKRSDIINPKVNQVEISVAENQMDYYVAVSALDIAGNESELVSAPDGSSYGPVRAIDNTPPLPVEVVSAFDTPDDFGGSITVSWTSPSPAQDFAAYKVYLSDSPIKAVSAFSTLRASIVIPDRNIRSLDLPAISDSISYFVAVTAIDKSGNESEISTKSTAGPVRTESNLVKSSESAIKPISVPSGLIRHNDLGVVWSRFSSKPVGLGYLVKLDDGKFEFVASNRAIFYDLIDGRHVISIKASDGENPPLVRSFTVNRTLIKESEPNDLEASANPLFIGMTLLAENSSDTDIDFYSLDLVSDGIVDLSYMRLPSGTSGTSGSGELSLYKGFVSSETLVGKLKVDEAVNQRGIMSLGVTRGRYILEVSASKGAYELSSEFRALETVRFWDQEPNDTPQKSNQVEFPADGRLEFVGSLTKNRDVDWVGASFKSAPTRGLLKVRAAKEAASVVKMSFYSDLPVEERKIGTISLELPTLQVAEFFAPVYAKSLFVKVESESEAPNLYSIELTTEPMLSGQTWEVEPNSSAATASRLALGQEIKGTNSDSGGDSDWFKLETLEDGMLVVNLNRTVGASLATAQPPTQFGKSKADLIIRNSAGAELTKISIDPKISNDGKVSLQTKRGVYFIEVRFEKDDLLSEYVLSAILDNMPPEIKAVKHNADKILTDAEVLKVTLEGEANGIATFNIGEFKTNLPMFDDGKHDDGAANDGIYSGSYTIRAGDKVSAATVLAKLTDESGNISQAAASQLVSIDTTIPEITSLSHSATKPLTIGEVLTVTLVGEPGNTASFGLVGQASSPVPISNIPLFDDGGHNDRQANDGTYVGSYLIREGDELQKGKVVAKLSKPNGKVNQRESLESITIDTRPPESVKSVQAKDKPNDEGGVIELSWFVGSGFKPAPTDDIDRYNIYFDKSPILSTKNRQPNWTVRNLTTSAGKRAVQAGDRIKIDLEVPENRTSYYFAVTVSDLAGNESPMALGEDASLSKATEAIDNLPPAAVRGVLATDRIGDRGFFITLSWKEPSEALDFDHYNIYMSSGKFTSTQGLKRITSVPDRNILTVDVPIGANSVDFFFGVAAVDRSGNESPLASDSGYGPVQAVDNIGVQPDTTVKIISGPLGLIRQSDVTFNWSRFESGIVGAGLKLAFSGYFIKLDDTPFQFTNSNHQSFFGLNPGKHEFFVKSADDSLSVSSRSFIVAPTFTSESEPNDNRIQANLAPVGISIRGKNHSDADVDWYRVQIEESGIVDLHFKRQLGIGKSVVSIYASMASDSKIGELMVESNNNQRNSLSLGVDLGEYFIQVISAGENPAAEYELSVSFNEGEHIGSPLHGVNFEVEPNDFAESARIIQPNFETVGLVNKPADRDWYRLEVSKAELRPDGSPSKLLRISLAKELGATPLTVSAYFSQPSDNFKVGFAALSKEKQITNLLIPVQNGIYFINVETTESSSTNYSIKATLEEIPADQHLELEPNSTTANANLLPIGSLIKGTSWHPEADVDLYKLKVEQRGVLALRLQRPSGLGSSLIELLDASQTVMAKAKTTIGVEAGFKPAPTADINSELDPGLYFIRIKPEGEVGFDEYIISAIMVKAADHAAFDVLSAGEALVVSLDWVAGNSATFDFGNIAKNIPMRDDGKEGDRFAQDGIYTGRYIVKSRDDITNGFIVINLETNSGASGRIKLAKPISIDTTPPKIVEVRHDAKLPLGVGKLIKVTLIGEPKATAEFKILGPGRVGAGLALPLLPPQPLFDDGKHDDGQTDDGIYGGVYEVILGDNITEASLIGILTDAAGNRAELEANRKVTLDTSSPIIRSLSHTPNRPLLLGDELIVTLEGEPKGSASFDIGTLRKGLKLFDDGTHSDKKADDGIYVGSYIVRQGDDLSSAVIKARLTDLASNESTAEDLNPVTLDTTPPKVTSITHNAKKPLRKDEVLIVNLKGDMDEKANFDIGSFKTDIPMFDDGIGKDTKANDGIYTGVYSVKEGDLARDVAIIGRLIDKSGNAATIRSSENVTIDSVPPPPVVGVSASDKTDDEGNRIIVSWKSAAPLEDFAHYNIYVESVAIRSTRGLTPIISNIASIDIISSEVVVANNNLDYYFAVTSIDSAGNESPLAPNNLSQAGPVRAVDNTPPKPLSLVSATNRPDDQGKTIIVKWTEPSEAADFDHYNIYLDTKPISSLSGLKPIMQVKGIETISVEVEVAKDKTDYYFAVTASDRNGNESGLDKDGKSAFGPMQSLDEKPPEAVKEVSAIDAPSDEGKRLIIFWKILDDPSVSHYNIYLSKLQVKNEKDLVSIEPAKELNVKAGASTINTPADEVEYYIAVTAVDFSDNESKLDKSGASVFGPVRSVSNLIVSDKITTITAGFDPKTSVTVPPGALKPNSSINITLPAEPQTLKRIDEANHLLQEAYIDPQFEAELVGTTRRIEAGQEKILKPIKIALSYPDFTDNPEIESDLRIFRLNEKVRFGVWQLVSGMQRVNTLTNTVTVEVERFSIFRVARLKSPERLDKLVVFPNPFMPSQSISGHVTFTNLAKDATIEIFSLAGERVRKIEVESGSLSATWDGKQEDGKEVAGGMYIYVVRNNRDKVVGKLVVVR